MEGERRRDNVRKVREFRGGKSTEVKGRRRRRRRKQGEERVLRKLMK